MNAGVGVHDAAWNFGAAGAARHGLPLARALQVLHQRGEGNSGAAVGVWAHDRTQRALASVILDRGGTAADKQAAHGRVRRVDGTAWGRREGALALVPLRVGAVQQQYGAVRALARRHRRRRRQTP
jgi:hypothetical protein